MSCTINITSVTENSITFHWATTQYRYVYLWYGTNQTTVANATSISSGTSGRVVINTASGTNKSGDYTLTGLSSYTTYYLKLGERQRQTGTTGTYSSVISAYTATPEALSSPTNLDSTPSYLTADVSWDAVTNATGYVVYYKKSTDTSYQSISSTTNSATLSSLTDDTAYTWYVVALGNDLRWLDSDASESDTFTTLAQTHLSAPTNLSTNLTSTTAELSWSTVANATGYIVYYKESGNTTYQTIERSTNSATIDSLSEGTRYYWHVVAVGNGSNYGDSIPSSDEMFQTEGFCVTSAHNIYVTDNTPTTTITWDYLDGAASYKVDLYRYPDSGEVLLSTETTQGNSAVVDLPDKIEVYVAIVTALSSSNETLASKEILMRRNARLRFMDLPSSTAELWVDGELLCDDITYNLMGQYADGTNKTSAATFTNDGKGLQIYSVATNATTYCYYVSQDFAIGGGTSSGHYLSDVVSGTRGTRTALAAPSGISHSYLSLGEVDLRWTAVANAHCYLITFTVSNTVFYRCWSETNYVEAKSDLFENKSSVQAKIYAYPSATGLDDTYCSSSAGTYSSSFTFSTASIYPVMVATEVKARYATIMWDATDYTGTGTSLTLYEYDVATGTKTQVGTISAQNGSTTLENLTPKTKYAIIGEDDVRRTKIEFTTPSDIPLPTPTNLASTPAYTTATVTWGAVTGAGGYTVYYKKTTDTDYLSTTTNTNSASLSSLTDDTAYTWYVVALESGDYGDSLPSESATFTTNPLPYASAPTGLSTTPACITSVVSWNAVPSAAQYKVYYKESTASSYSSITSNSNSATITGLTADTQYTWYVAAIGDGVNWSTTEIASNTATLTTNPYTPRETPTGLSASANITRATLTWNAVSGATSYIIYFKPSTADSYTYLTSTTNSVAIECLSASSTYSWYVVALGDYVLYSDSQSAVATFTTSSYIKLTTPSSLAATPSCTKADISWSAVTNATGYRVFYKTSSASEYTSIANPSNEAVLTGLANNTTYNWHVVAYGEQDYEASNASNASTFTTGTPTKLTTPTNLVATASTTSATLTWAEVSHATRYELMYRAANSTTPTIVSCDTNSATLSSLTENVAYKWTVIAIGDGDAYLNSDVATGARFTPGVQNRLATPCNLQASYEGNATPVTVEFSWDAVTNATDYTFYIQYYLDGSDHNEEYHSDYSGIVIALDNPNVEYTWRVVATNSGGTYVDSYPAYSRFGIYDSLTQLDTPTNLSATATKTTATLSWDAVANASSYVVYYLQSDGTETSTTSTTNSKSLSSLSDATAYYWYVVAVGDGSTYANSNASSYGTFTTTEKPVFQTVTGFNVSVTSSSADLSWTAVTGASQYRIYYKKESDSSYSSVTASSNTRVLSSLPSGTTYLAYIIVVNTSSSDTSSPSDIISFKTLARVQLANTVGLRVNPTATKAVLSWDSVEGADNYEIGYSKVGVPGFTYTSAITDHAYTLSSLTPETEYECKLKAYSSDGVSSSSQTIRFSTLELLQLDTPTGLTAVTTISSENTTVSTATLSWNVVANASSYKVYYKKETDSSYSEITYLTNSATIEGLSNCTRYNWYVVAIGDESLYVDSLPSSVETFQTNGLNVTSAHQIYVTDNTATTTITWDSFDGAASYKVDLYRYPDSGEVLLSTETTQGNSTVVDLPDKIEVYVAIVTALSSSNEDLASEQIFMRRNARLRFMDFLTTTQSWPRLSTSTAELWVDGELLCDDITYYLMGLYADGTNRTTKTTFTNDGRGLQIYSASIDATTYGYRVEQAFAIGGGTRYSYSLSDIVLGTQKTRTALSDPSGISFSYLSLGEVDLRWTAVANAHCYLIEFIVGGTGTVFYRCWSETNYVEAKSDLFVDKSGVQANIYAYPSATGLDDTYCSSGAGEYRYLTFTTPSIYPVIVATEVKARYATIMWDASNYTGTGTLTLYEYNVATGTKTQVGTISAKNASTTLENLTPETKYVIIGEIGSRNSNKLEFTTPSASVPLTAPTGLIADQVTSTSARVGWNVVENASDYKVEYRQQGQTNWLEQ